MLEPPTAAPGHSHAWDLMRRNPHLLGWEHMGEAWGWHTVLTHTFRLYYPDFFNAWEHSVGSSKVRDCRGARGCVLRRGVSGMTNCAFAAIGSRYRCCSSTI